MDIREVLTPIEFQGKILKLRHIELRKKQRGPPVILLPGINGFAESYYWNLQTIYSAGYWPMALDNLGFGGSDKLDGGCYEFSMFSEAAVEWIKKKELDDIVLVGNSLGGGVSVGIWEFMPDNIKAMVLVSSAGFGNELSILYRIASLPGIAEFLSWIIINPYLPLNKGRKAWKSIVYNHNTLPEELIELSNNFKKDSGIRKTYQYVLRNFISFKGQSPEVTQHVHRASHKIRESNMPVLIIWGQDDHVIPISHAYSAAEHTDGNLLIFENCGHMPYVEQVQRFNHEMHKFLKSLN